MDDREAMNLIKCISEDWTDVNTLQQTKFYGVSLERGERSCGFKFQTVQSERALNGGVKDLLHKMRSF